MAIKVASLISEDNESLSMGRVAFWVLLIADFIYWFAYSSKPFPPTLYDMTMCVLIYNFGKKGVSIADDWVKLKTEKSVVK
jgi:hypothetical protein